MHNYFSLSIPTFRYVHGYLRTCRVVLDIGCSHGDYLQLLSDNSIGIDVDLSALRESRAKGLRVVCADADKPLPFLDASIEGILASHVMEHTRSPIAFLEELHRVLVLHGVLVIGLPVEGGIASHRLRYFKGHRGIRGHLYSFSPDNLDELLYLSGFRLQRLFFHIAKIGYKKRLIALHNLMQTLLPNNLLYRLSSAYWAVAIKVKP